MRNSNSFDTRTRHELFSGAPDSRAQVLVRLHFMDVDCEKRIFKKASRSAPIRAVTCSGPTAQCTRRYVVMLAWASARGRDRYVLTLKENMRKQSFILSRTLCAAPIQGEFCKFNGIGTALDAKSTYKKSQHIIKCFSPFGCKYASKGLTLENTLFPRANARSRKKLTCGKIDVTLCDELLLLNEIFQGVPLHLLHLLCDYLS